MASQVFACLHVAFDEAAAKRSLADEDGCTTAAPSPPLTYCADAAWSRQSTDIPPLELESFATSDSESPLEAIEDDGRSEWSEEDDEGEDEAACRRIALAARRLALGRAEDEDGEVSEAELDRACERMGRAARRLALMRSPVAPARRLGDETDGEDSELEEAACRRMGLAARRLALGRHEDEDGEVSDAEVEAAASRMGAFARAYALRAGAPRGC